MVFQKKHQEILSVIPGGCQELPPSGTNIRNWVVDAVRTRLDWNFLRACCSLSSSVCPGLEQCLTHSGYRVNIFNEEMSEYPTWVFSSFILTNIYG